MTKRNSLPIALLGSARRHGNTGALLDCIASDITMEIVDLGSVDVSPYDYEHNNLGDDFVPLLKRLLEHDDILFASPVYWYSMSAQMKVFFDRLSDVLDVNEFKGLGRALRGKRAHIVSTSIHPTADPSFVEAFEKTFDYLGVELGGTLHVDCSDGFCRLRCEKSLRHFIAPFALGQGAQ